ncbi:NAD-dependent epimerase/dehydratase family protein [Psychrobacillus glaciei]|uniref:NAD-dependent epimerase/dehydratase family protein n=1 Tax=Psychrobacillus glaciei TaxID=2283160 RepID=A0A5J6SKY1_9BACI|nr:NAD-dependent epimerase/dehydratase family protein [Psychrobacillus glaciei]QFF98093.1 NAD-dependent epimerase/dehydratase family protein [Psychrobacillus glaciei]
MRKALVLGGTKFFGVHLVEALLEKGFEVTIATRGKTVDPFSTRVKRIACDRLNLVDNKERFENEKWDIIFDQICYSSQEAMDAIEVFKDKTDKYVFTSSKSVYDEGNGEVGYVEDDFIPKEYKIIQGPKEDFSYNEGKRLAEAVFFQNAPFPVVAVRFPIVIGLNDYTERLNFYIEKIASQGEIHLINPDACMDFISEEEAGQFLAWIGLSDFTGPVNATSEGKVKLSELISIIEDKTKATAIISSAPSDNNVSPYNIAKTWLISNERAKSLGYKFRDLNEYMPLLIEDTLKKIR